MKVISTPNAPAAIGPYAQGYIANGMVFTSGQLPVDPAAGTMPEGIAAQAEQSCKNVGAVLAAGGTGARQRDQDHLLPRRYERLCGVQRGLRPLFYQLPGQKLRCSESASPKCPV